MQLKSEGGKASDQAWPRLILLGYATSWGAAEQFMAAYNKVSALFQ